MIKNKIAKISFLVGLVAVLAASFCFGLETDDIAALVDEDYFKAVQRELKAASESIYVEMYLAKLEEKTEGYVFRLADELTKAYQRGIEVKIILEDAPWHEMNKNFYDFLAKEGIDVTFDAPNKVLHSKVVVIDAQKTIIGSHNWSYYALRLNHEAGVLIESKEVAQAILDGTYKEDEPDIVILDENNYFRELINGIRRAKESVSCVIFEYELNPKRKFTKTWQLAQEIITASERGVNVRIILDQNFKRQEDRFGREKTIVEKKNLTA